ncbi:MAG: hypothetical protein IJW05_14920 [Lentisphaeria bacterium]|nr:hypothetical protein [Lentisphaeria bacterium]MBQ7404720.1 hypothetical protein [Lentisphaeria bacterium]
MAQRAASYGKAVLHKSLTMKLCFAAAPQYEAASFHSAMKHSLRSYDEKMKNESLSVCNTTLPRPFFCSNGQKKMKPSGFASWLALSAVASGEGGSAASYAVRCASFPPETLFR